MKQIFLKVYPNGKTTTNASVLNFDRENKSGEIVIDYSEVDYLDWDKQLDLIFSDGSTAFVTGSGNTLTVPLLEAYLKKGSMTVQPIAKRLVGSEIEKAKWQVVALSVRDSLNVLENDVSITPSVAEQWEIRIDAVEDAEAVRVQNEIDRESSEGTRGSNESTRGQNESTRQSNENTRIINEQARVIAEPLRITAEQGRVSAEGVRIGAEQGRVSAEGLRVNAEQGRASAESTRVTQETGRVNAENVRLSSETLRIENEIARNTFVPYSGSTAYLAGNKVSYLGSSYVAKSNTTGNLPTNTTYWLLIAQKGDNTTASDVTFTPTGNLSSTNVQTALVELDNEKVDKVTGKGLSTNDYTTEEKSKVSNLPSDTNAQLVEIASGEGLNDNAITLSKIDSRLASDITLGKVTTSRNLIDSSQYENVLFSSVIYDAGHKSLTFKIENVKLSPTRYYKCDVYFADGSMAPITDGTIEYLNGLTVIATTNLTDRKLVGVNANNVTHVRFSWGGTGRTLHANKAIKGFKCFESMDSADVSTVFEPFSFVYAIKNVAGIKQTDIFLPSEIYCAVGRTIELYNNQVCLKAEDYNIRWNCAVGRAMKRKFIIEGLAGLIGTYPLTLEVYNDNLDLLYSATTTIKIVDATIVNTYNYVALGDSLSGGYKDWLSEVRRLSAGKLNQVGRIPYTQVNPVDGLTYNGFTDGRGGFSAKSYLSATTSNDSAAGGINEGVHAFWSSARGRFSWSHYVTNTLGGVSPSFIQIFLGTNGINIEPGPNANYIKQIIDYIRQDDPTMPIYMVNTLYRGNQDGIGRQGNNEGSSASQGDWKYNEDRKVFNLMVRLKEILAGYSNLYFIPVATTHDSENNFGAVATPVNPRAEQNELLPVESVHPQKQGYLQMADIMFSTFAGTLT